MHKQIVIIILCLTFLTGCAGTMPKLGINNGLLTPCPNKPNCVSSQASDKQHSIEPIQFTGTPQDTQDRLLQILRGLKRTEIILVQEDYIRAEFTSAIFRFVDDVEFYFPATNTATIIVHFRSASRIGHSDLGANRKRIELIRDKFKVD